MSPSPTDANLLAFFLGKPLEPNSWGNARIHLAKFIVTMIDGQFNWKAEHLKNVIALQARMVCGCEFNHHF